MSSESQGNLINQRLEDTWEETEQLLIKYEDAKQI